MRNYIKRISHFWLFLGASLFVFNGIFHPLFHHGFEVYGELLDGRSYCGGASYSERSENGSAFAWRHDDLCPLCTSVLFALPPDSADGVALDCLPYAVVPERRQSIFTPVLETAVAPRAPPAIC